MKTGYDHTWFVLTQRIIEREFVLSGSDQNPDLTGKNILVLIKHALTGASAQIEGFKRDGIDFVVKRNLHDLVNGINRITGEPLIDLTSLQREIEAHDREIANPFTTDSQITAIWGSRTYLGDKLARTAKAQRLLDPKARPLIAVRLNIVTRKTLGGMETDLAGCVIRDDHEPLPGLYAAGEVAGFGGGGVHGYRALEGTLLGSCLFSGRVAGRAAVHQRFSTLIPAIDSQGSAQKLTKACGRSTRRLGQHYRHCFSGVVSVPGNWMRRQRSLLEHF